MWGQVPNGGPNYPPFAGNNQIPEVIDLTYDSQTEDSQSQQQNSYSNSQDYNDLEEPEVMMQPYIQDTRPYNNYPTPPFSPPVYQQYAPPPQYYQQAPYTPPKPVFDQYTYYNTNNDFYSSQYPEVLPIETPTSYHMPIQDTKEHIQNLPPNMRWKSQIIQKSLKPPAPPPEPPVTYKIMINNLPVSFPYPEPYESQKIMIGHSLTAFATSTNALLESPTGTGKGLALLASTLAYQEADKNINRIYYTSRTHGQLKQIIDEYRRLPQRRQMGLLASKKHCCINEEVKDSDDVDKLCNKAVDGGRCPYFTKNVTIPEKFTLGHKKEVFQIEDVLKYCSNHKHSQCPYFLNKALAAVATIIFCPYNYVFSQFCPEIKIGREILIIDEGHNIESFCRDNASLTVSYVQQFVAGEVARIHKERVQRKSLYQAIEILSAGITKFLKQQHENYINTRSKEPYMVVRNTYQEIQSWGYRFPQLSQLGHEMNVYVSEVMTDMKPNQPEIVVAFCSIFGPVFSVMDEVNIEDFRIVFIPADRDQDTVMKILCLRPAIVFKKFTELFRSVIIASGTLSPFESFESELETQFKIKESVPHVIGKDQVITMTINDHNNIALTSKFSDMKENSKCILTEVGRIVQTILPVVPGGALFFMPSYKCKSDLIRTWKENRIFNDIKKMKKIVEEDTNEKANVIKNKFVKIKGGGFLMGVCRGKMSEGLDFTDDQARIIFIFGIPYPAIRDPQIELKMKYNNEKSRANSRTIGGSQWYSILGFRALFQTIGRVIRHKGDYGAVVLMDIRIQENLSKFPDWIKNNFYTHQNVQSATKMLSIFYTKMHERFPDHLPPPFPCHEEIQQEKAKIQSVFRTKSEPIAQFDFKINPIPQPKKSKTPTQQVPKLEPLPSNPNDSKQQLDIKPQACQEPPLEPSVKESMAMTLYCSSCTHEVLKILHIEESDFPKLDDSIVLGLLSEPKPFTAMLIQRNNVFKVLSSIGDQEYSKTKECVYQQLKCDKCGTIIGANISQSSTNSQYAVNSLLLRIKCLKIAFQNTFISLEELANG